MRKDIYIIFLILPALLFGQIRAQSPPDTVASAPGLTIETAVDRAEIFIGDLINYRLTIIHDSDIILTPPPIGANLGAFDVKDYKVEDDIRLEDGRLKSESRFLLTTFTTGDYIIPPIPVEFMTLDSTKKFLISEPITIKVKSLLAEDADTADIFDIKGPITLKSGIPFLYFLIGGAILIIVVALIIRWVIRRRKREGAEPVDLRDPWEIAFEALAVLKEKNYAVSGEVKLFYVEITAILREYLQRIYKMPVLDMTTYEFLVAVVQEDIEEELYNRFKRYLEFADLVKFAKLIPEIERINVDFEEAVNIVEYIRQKEMSRIQMPEAAAATSEEQNV